MKNRNQPDSGEKHVSIVIATYNAAEYLPFCLKSIDEQRFKDLELIIVDGGSTDNTLEIIKAYKGVPLQYKSEPDKGIYNAFNKGVKMISGKWCLFLGADDKLLDGFSDLAAQLADVNTLYYGDYYVKGNRYGKSYSAYQMAKKTYCHQAIFYPSHVFEKVVYNEAYTVFADYALNIWCWGAKQLKKQYLPHVVADYNPDGFSSYASDAHFRADKPLLIKKYLGALVYLRYRLKKFKESRSDGSKFF